MPLQDYLSSLRQRNIWNPQMFGPGMYGNDLPQQGGITGNMPQQDFSQEFPTQNPYQNIFQQSPIQTPPTPTPGVNDPNDVDVNALYSQFYHPEHAASDRFTQLANAYPQDQGHSKLARIGAALLAGGTTFATDDIGTGVKLGTGVLEHNQNSRVEDWKNQITPAYNAANLERTTNANERQTATSMVNQRLADRKQEQANAIAEEKTRIADLRAQVYKLKNERPDYEFDSTGPTVTVKDPATGKVWDSGFKTAHMTDMDKIILGQKNAMEQIGARTAGAKEVAGINSRSREGISKANRPTFNVLDPESGQYVAAYRDENGNFVRATMDAQPVTDASKVGTAPTNKPMTPTQSKVDVYNKALEIINTDAELKKYVKIKSNGEVTVVAPGEGGYFGDSPSPEQYNRIKTKLYGSAGPTGTGQKSETGSVRVKSPDGRTGTWDLSKGPVPQGFTKIQ